MYEKKPRLLLTKDRMMALSVLIQYWKVAGTRTKQSAMGFSAPSLKAFMQRLTPVSDLQIIYDRYEKIFANAASYEGYPPYIQQAIVCAFDYRPKGVLAGNGEIEDIINKMACAHKERLANFNSTIAGVYLCYRYSATPSESADRPSNGVNEPAGRQDIVKASFEIYKPEGKRRFPRFELRYKPSHRPSEKTPYNTGVGSVVLLDGARHLLFLGEDQRTYYPLYIIANYDAQAMDCFNGLVVRLHESGQFFASRCCFVRSEKKLSALNQEIGLYPDTAPEIAQDLSDIRDLIKNVITDKQGAVLHMHY